MFDSIELFRRAKKEAIRARELFPKPDHLLHALTEEHGEVVKAALDIYGGKGNYVDLDKEIVQCMAMCIRLHEEGDPAINLKAPADIVSIAAQECMRMDACPFCGCNRLQLCTTNETASAYWFVECQNCNSTGAERESRNSAVEAWNQRHKATKEAS